MKITINEQVEQDAKTLKIYIKVRDMFCAGLVNAEGKEIKDYEGYVPDFMPGEHFGDYLDLEINLESGQILNWVKPTPQQIQDFVESNGFGD